MQMSEILDKLKSLQDVLAEKYEIELKLEDLPKSIESNLGMLENFKKEYIDLNAEYEAEKSRISALRVDLDEAIKTREISEKGMDDVGTHREYDILEGQIKEAEERENSIRREIQKQEKKLEDLDERLKQSASLISATENDVTEQKASMAKELESYNAQLVALKDREATMSEGIDSETIFKFQRIIQRNRKGIVAVRGNVCDGCHMILPAQFANEVRRGDKILFCPYCSRILFYEEETEEGSSFYSMDEAGSLADDFDDDISDDFDDEDEGYSSELDGDEDDLENQDDDDSKSSMDYDDN